ncbi:MAG: glycine betaine ABC transporter substrate-binding protein [Burkholderiales bacterium]|nr:glycine betaine ABC transporter substrate-binding protein [Burkholderiales bacterium]
MAFPQCVRALIAGILLLAAASAVASDVLRVGSKRFTESYVLGEIITQTASASGARVEHKAGLGNTGILFAALKSGAIDVYPDYTGTIALELLGLAVVPQLEELNRRLYAHGLAAGVFTGFSNSYALAMAEPLAASRGIRRISDLRDFLDARLGLSLEFLSRRDGWAALSDAYEIGGLKVRGLEHGLAYAALQRGDIDVIDVYTTDPQINRLGLRVLEDDRRFFPDYESVLVYRLDLPARHPVAWTAIEQLQGRISAATMLELNAAVELERRSFADAARAWLAEAAAPPRERSVLAAVFAPDLLRLTIEHVRMVLVSLLLSVALGVPLGLLAQRAPRAGRWILAGAGVLQTVPSLALLAFLIALLDRIGPLPAIIALALYALLPVIRGTEVALTGVGRQMRDAGLALGLNGWQLLRLVELPLAWPGILAGIRTAAVINVGTATIAAFVGAGGYGERIVAGLAVNDQLLMLSGAIPAAVLAVLIESAFRMLERKRQGGGPSGF